jgi:hypothetical protein
MLLMEKIYTSRKTCTQESHYSYACMFKLDTMYRFKFKRLEEDSMNVIANR